MLSEPILPTGVEKKPLTTSRVQTKSLIIKCSVYTNNYQPVKLYP